MIQKMKSTVIFTLKNATYIMIGLTYFLIMSLGLPQLSRSSRTLAVGIVTFIGVFYVMQKIYGKYDINVRRSKAVVISLILCTLFTDIVVYFILVIMSYNAQDIFAVQKMEYFLALIAFLIQSIVIYFMVYFGNSLYFKIYQPTPTCLIVDNQHDNSRYFKTINRYRKQFNINGIVHYENSTEVLESIDQNKHVFFLNIPLRQREEYIKYCYKKYKFITFTPDVSDIARMNCIDTTIDDIPLFTYNANERTMEQRVLKRAFDIVFSLFAIIISSPIWLLVAIMIKREDGGRVFFLQDRVTLNNKTFKIIKFRSMVEDNGEFKQAIENDERITRVGKFIRRFRIDELPQFINVLIGDMSIVGPRPEAKESYVQIQTDIPEFEYRTRVKAGITGLAQIYGKYNTPPLDKLKFDITYIEQFSLMLDIKLIFLTISVFFKKESVETNKE